MSVAEDQRQRIDRLVREIQQRRRLTVGGRKKPHKLIMLLTVLDLVDAGHITENRIYFGDELRRRFTEKLSTYGGHDDSPLPAAPFFHLRSAPFWHLKAKPGREAAYRGLTTSGGGIRRVRDNVAFAYLSDYAYEAISDPEGRCEIRGVIEELLSCDS